MHRFLAALLTQFIANLIDIGQFVGQFGIKISTGVAQHHIAIGIFFHLLGGQVARGGHILDHILPNVLQECRNLLAVGGTHFCFGEGFDGALELSDAEHLHLDAHLLQQVFVEHRLGGEAVPINHARGVHPQLVGHAGHIVCALRILVAIGQDELLALLEIHKGLADFLEGSHVGADGAAFDVDALHALVGLGHADGCQNLVKPLLVHVHDTHEAGHRVVGRLLFNDAVEAQM